MHEIPNYFLSAENQEQSPLPALTIRAGDKSLGMPRSYRTTTLLLLESLVSCSIIGSVSQSLPPPAAASNSPCRAAAVDTAAITPVTRKYTAKILPSLGGQIVTLTHATVSPKCCSTLNTAKA